MIGKISDVYSPFAKITSPIMEEYKGGIYYDNIHITAGRSDNSNDRDIHNAYSKWRCAYCCIRRPNRICVYRMGNRPIIQEKRMSP